VFEIDMEHCRNCGSEPTIIAATHEAEVIEHIRERLGLPARARLGGVIADQDLRTTCDNGLLPKRLMPRHRRRPSSAATTSAAADRLVVPPTPEMASVTPMRNVGDVWQFGRSTVGRLQPLMWSTADSLEGRESGQPT
jgi:hypothetical protein